MSSHLRGPAVLLPADPPRDSRLALADSGHGAKPTEIEVFVAPGDVRHTVTTWPVRLAEVLPALLDPAAHDRASETLRFFSAAATVALTLVSRGRLLPGISPAGFDTWRVGPLDDADRALVDALVAACPPEAHATVVTEARMPSAEATVALFLDAVADTIVRTAAAPLAAAGPAYAVREPVDARALESWLAEAGVLEQSGIRLGIRLEPTGADDPVLRGVLQVRDRAHPEVVVDAADVWASPADAAETFGANVDSELLLALRRAARGWRALEPLLTQRAPAIIDIDDDAIADLLAGAADELAGCGVEVVWPPELGADEFVVRAVVLPPPASDGRTFSLTQLLDFRWEIAVGGEPLTPEELDLLAHTTRPLVRLRGRLVRVDRNVLDRVGARATRRLSAMEALAGALTGSLVIDGGPVEFRTSGALLELSERLRDLATRREGGVTGPPPTRFRGTLRPYQLRGLDWMAELTELGLGGCLADDMGLGKTVQVIALHLRRHERDGATTGPTLVVCPTSLLGNWEREIRRFAPGTPVRRFHGHERHLDDVRDDEIVLATYGLVRRDREVLAEIEWDLVVADEAQAVKNPLSRTARELRALPSSARIALTGTPVENRLSDLWSILDWATPGLLGPLERFRRTVALPVERYQDPDAIDRLARVVRPFLLRRRKSDPGIAPELPPKTETDLVVPLTPEQVTLYDAVVRDALDAIRQATGISRRGLVLKLLTALKQICNHPAQYLSQEGPLRGRSGKLTALDSLLEIVLDEGDSVLVFTQYVAMARLLESHLTQRGVETLFLHGGTPARQRERMVERFQAGETPVFLLSLKAGGTGLNLTRATHVVHYDRWWNPAVEDQATDRAYRIGQDRPVQVHRLMTEGTLEDRIAGVMARKRLLAESVVGTGEAWLSELSDSELAELVELRDEM